MTFKKEREDRIARFNQALDNIALVISLPELFVLMTQVIRYELLAAKTHNNTVRMNRLAKKINTSLNTYTFRKDLENHL